MKIEAIDCLIVALTHFRGITGHARVYYE